MKITILVNEKPEHCGECPFMYWGMATLEPKCTFKTKFEDSHGDVAFELRDGIRPSDCPFDRNEDINYEIPNSDPELE